MDAVTELGGDEWRAMDEESSAHHLTEALTSLVTAGIIADQPAEPLARLLPGAMNEAAPWLARSGQPEALEDQTVRALDRLLAGLRTEAGSKSGCAVDRDRETGALTVSACC
ncbi:hypothetical protein [Streptomyces sp. SAJ15]|uniref:hypothetical protein n=1 Tax=Streptomyces sp. SAJ15 TaxID=2011095 RepID=UPI0011867034|nr:hypothetical protein [Streptomyces sp. SAJ15]